jgi:hypothetical protein
MVFKFMVASLLDYIDSDYIGTITAIFSLLVEGAEAVLVNDTRPLTPTVAPTF